MSKNLSQKYSQKLLDHAKFSTTDALKTASKKAIQKNSRGIGGLIGNKIANTITKASRTSPQNSSETVESETENIGINRKMHKERYIYPEKTEYYWWSKINITI